MLFKKMIDMDHEQVVHCYDEASGLKAIIAVHNTVLGPSLGGCRMWNYSSEEDALNDVLRLSRGMTFKASITGLNLGGGKAVILADSKKDKSEMLWRRFGQFVDSLNGKYITAEDVGTSPRDIEYIQMETNNVAGVPKHLGGGGDPSPVTAYGTYLGMKASAQKAFGSDSLEGKTVSVQGVGSVGEHLVKLLRKENATVFITDINTERLNKVASKYGAEIVAPEDIYDKAVDIYSPCALGGTINDETLEILQCRIIAGAANNQLANEASHGKKLMAKGIIYAPDFLINAGGLVNCYVELGDYSEDRAYKQTDLIYDRTLEIFEKADAESIPTQEAAIRIAKERIERAKSLNARL